MEISSTLLVEHIEALVGPRHHGNAEAEKRINEAEVHILEKLQEYGWQTIRQDFDFKEMITAWGRVHENRNGCNIIAEKPGKVDQVLIIATHHDTVSGSPGADDNGTGVAALLELARLLAQSEMKYTLRLISFDLEEAGLIGSEYYVQSLSEHERGRIKGMIMLEMLGYFTHKEQELPQGFGMLYRKEINRLKHSDGILYGDFLTCIFRGDAKFIARAFKHTERENMMKVGLIRDAVDLPVVGRILERLVPSLQNLLRSDHTPFWYRNIPAVMITDTANFRNRHYHLPSDTLDTINVEGFCEATERVLAAVRYIDQHF